MSLSDKLSQQVSQVPRSGIRDFFELVQGRDDVISLGVGEPDFATPWHIREAVIYSLGQGKTSYTSNLGLPSLREAIGEHVRNEFGVGYDAESEIIVTVGVSEALDLAFRALLNPGDEVVYHEPCYVSYSPSIVMAYGKAVPVATRAKNRFALMAADVEAALTDRTKVLVLNFPTNPTGGVMSETELAKVAKLCIERDLIVVSDEIYSELRYAPERAHPTIIQQPGMRERTVFLHGFSKAFAMTGFRLGYACAPAELTEAMMKIHQYSMLCAPISSQVAAIEALENGAASVEKMRLAYERRRSMVLHRLETMGIPCYAPGGTFYVFPDIRGTGLTSREFAVKLLEEENVAVVPGDAFGPSGEGFVRCCFGANPDDLKVAMERMSAFVDRTC
ncbi:MAG: aminotransferase class I/II-fold pyridoxal phosphate-dependent enzyme [Verrucomicrobiota bacterium]